MQDRAAWDAETAAAMGRMGVVQPVAAPAPAPARASGAEGFRLMDIIHMYADDRCR